MRRVVSITSQGQLTIPKSIRRSFGIKGAVKAVVRKKGRTIIVEPKYGFWSLEGMLKSSVRLSDSELRKARDSFGKKWGASWSK
jgi:AbrB family looped-hinge helix DNA binding protein